MSVRKMDWTISAVDFKLHRTNLVSREG